MPKGNEFLIMSSNINKNIYSKEFLFNLKKNKSEVYFAVIRNSFSALKGVNWRNIEKFSVGDILKSKDNKRFKITKLEIPSIYEIETIRDEITYFVCFELTDLSEEKTEVKFTEKIEFSKKVSNLNLTIAKMNFDKDFVKKQKQIVLSIQKELEKNYEI